MTMKVMEIIVTIILLIFSFSFFFFFFAFSIFIYQGTILLKGMSLGYILPTT